MKIFKVILINLLVCLLLSEVSLRIFWKNPYLLPAENAFIHHPHLHTEFHRLDQIYEGAHDPVYFNTSSLGYIEGPLTRTLPTSYAVAVGGSTTESATVQEGKRWTDLLTFPVLNYGKSRMYSVNSYFNIRHILGTQGLRPRWIFVMDGVNNLSAFLRYGKGALDDAQYRYMIRNGAIDFALKRIYSVSFLWRLSKEMNYLHFYQHEASKSLRLPLISEDEFFSWVELNRPLMRNELLSIFRKMKAEVEAHGARLLMLTQPHSFRDDYHPFQENDLRVYPSIGGKRTSLRQAGALMDIFNEETKNAARELGIEIIDVASCFSSTDVSSLIYDSVHFTSEGCSFMAKCIRDSGEEAAFH